MAELIVIEELQAYLVAQGVCRMPNTTGSLPACWLDPRDGAGQPGEPDTKYASEDATVTLRQTLAVLQDPLIARHLEEPVVDVIVRARRSPAAELIQRQVRRVLVDKRLFTMGSLLVEQCEQWRPDQSLGADDRSYDRIQSFRFLVRTKALAGLPYVP